ncbi:MAG: hypothetical protein ABJN52_04130 [Litorimonas sp.]
MKYLTVDAMPTGTGVRDSLGGGFYSLEELNVPSYLIEEFATWIANYKMVIQSATPKAIDIEQLDRVGLGLCRKLSSELSDVKVEYFSEGKSEKIWISPANH